VEKFLSQTKPTLRAVQLGQTPLNSQTLTIIKVIFFLLLCLLKSSEVLPAASQLTIDVVLEPKVTCAAKINYEIFMVQ